VAEIFNKTIENKSDLGGVHTHAACFASLSDHLIERDEKDLLKLVAVQIETSGLVASFGLYRSAFASVRLALEIGTAAIYFSANKFVHKEWLSGQEDIRWSVVNDENTGVFSKRFARAFFPACETQVDSFRHETNTIYRSLSEFVHGNSATWNNTGLALHYSESKFNEYIEIVNSVSRNLKFAFILRHLTSLESQAIDDIGPYVLPDLSHVAPISEYFGIRKA